MKQFKAPTLTIVDGYSLEPVYASSGSEPGGGGGDEPQGDWVITTEWHNHNTGSHSEIKVKAHNYGSMSGDNLAMTFIVEGFELVSLIPGDECLSVSNLTRTGFVLNRTNRHFNSGENIEFVMQLKGKVDGTEKIGAVGVTGEPCSYQVICTGYLIS